MHRRAGEFGGAVLVSAMKQVMKEGTLMTDTPNTGSWLIRRGDDEFVAPTIEALIDWLKTGRVLPTDFVWHPTLTSWMRPQEVPAIQAIQRATEPSLSSMDAVEALKRIARDPVGELRRAAGEELVRAPISTKVWCVFFVLFYVVVFGISGSMPRVGLVVSVLAGLTATALAIALLMHLPRESRNERVVLHYLAFVAGVLVLSAASFSGAISDVKKARAAEQRVQAEKARIAALPQRKAELDALWNDIDAAAGAGDFAKMHATVDRAQRLIFNNRELASEEINFIYADAAAFTAENKHTESERELLRALELTNGSFVLPDHSAPWTVANFERAKVTYVGKLAKLAREQQERAEHEEAEKVRAVLERHARRFIESRGDVEISKVGEPYKVGAFWSIQVNYILDDNRGRRAKITAIRFNPLNFEVLGADDLF